MISVYDQERIKSILDRFMEARSGIETSVPDLMNCQEIAKIIDYDLPEAEDQLKIFMERHENDCTVMGMNPLRIKYTLPSSDDPEQRIIREKYISGRRRFRQGKFPVQRPYRRSRI